MSLETKTVEAGSFAVKASGEFSVAFSPTDVVDLDGDIVRRSAIPDGLKLPLMQAHMQYEPPVGIGTVSHSSTHAILTGNFIDSSKGRDARETLKATADIQEFSWGFSIKESNIIDVEGKQVREITQTLPHEVSIVLRGAAGPGRTGVLAVKEDGGLSFAAEAETVRAAVLAFKGRAAALAALREGDGRELSASIKSQLREIADELSVGLDTLVKLSGVIEETKASDDDAELQARLRAAHINLLSPTARGM